MFQKPGTPRIKLLAVSGTPVLYLPIPDKGQPQIEWVEKGQVKELIDGSEVNRRLGWIPQLTLRWAIYVDQIDATFVEGVTGGAFGYIIGNDDGQMPSMTGLLNILSAKPGNLSVSPGPTAGWFTPQSWKINPIGLNPLGQAEGVEVVFRGGISNPVIGLGTV